MRKILLLISLWSASLLAADFPMVIDPVINATPPGAKVTAGYLTLVNNTDKKIVITGVYSPTISKVEMHLSSVKNDVARMEKQDTLTIDAGGRLEFVHGSYHLMLMDLTKPLKENDMVDIIFTTSVGDMLIEMPVLKPGSHVGSTMHSDMHKDEQTDMENHDHSKSDEQADMDKEAHSDMKAGDHGDMKKDDDTFTGKTKVVH